MDPNTGRVRGQPSRVTSATGLLGNFSQSNNGKRFAFVGMRSRDTIQVADVRREVEGLGTPNLLTGDNWDKWLDGWTLDSREVVFGSNPQGKWGIFKQEVRTHQTQTLLSGPDRYDSPVVTSDGQWLLFRQSSHEDRTGSSARLMRMPMNGGSTTVVVKGNFSYACAVQAPVCVLSELTNDKRVFSWLDPLKGRGRDLAQTSATSATWTLSPDGKSIALLPKAEGDQIQVINTADGKTRSIEPKDWQVQSIAWSPGNQHLYASGFSATTFSIRLVGLDGNFKSLSEVPAGQAWITNPKPSPDGHYLAYVLRTWESNVTMLENF